MIKNSDLFNLNESILKDFFLRYSFPYEMLPNIHDYILELGPMLDKYEYTQIKDNVWIHKSVTMDDGVEIVGPAIILSNVQLRHNAYLRENVIIGPNSTIGNSCEIKNSIIIGNSQIPHFNYVGDSILGNHVHLGAGVIVSNLRLDKQNILVDGVDTKLRKIGAFIGDNVEIGCNSVLNPGTIIYPNAVIYPLCVVKKIVHEGEIYKDKIELARL